jgi:Outer membrane protein beta-barrel family
MIYRMKLYLLLLFSLLSMAHAVAQESDLYGIIRLTNGAPSSGIHVWLYCLPDTTQFYVQPTDEHGAFRFHSIRRGTYRFEASTVGLKKIVRVIQVKDINIDLGTINMTEAPINIGAVTIEGRVPPATQNGDTTEFNANAFKTHPDATIEELVTKMPGVTVDNTGTVQSNGETVQRVLIDGKPFFGDDPTLAIRNLPAEIVEKIQVFDQMSDQAQFTGFDDGQYIKTMNVITRTRTAHSDFGKFAAGYGDDDRYESSGSYNIFNGNQRFTLLASSNNTNTQSFSMQDLFGVMSGSGQARNYGMGGGRRGSSNAGGTAPRAGIFTPGSSARTGASIIGMQQGINTTSFLGGNYSDSISRGMFLQMNYFFNETKNQNNQDINRQYLFSSDSSSLYDQQSDINGMNYNHRFSARWDYAIDKSNSIIFTPQFAYQDNHSSNSQIDTNSLTDGTPISQTQTQNQTMTTGNNLAGHLTLRHKFDTQGRTISLDIGFSESYKESSTNLNSLSSTLSGTADSIARIVQYSNGTASNIAFAPSLVYTEPLGGNHLLEINYQPTYSLGKADTRTYGYDSLLQQYNFRDSLSNTYKTQYQTQAGGLGYRYSDSTMNFNMHIEAQQAYLSNEQTFPYSASTRKIFTTILPNAMFNWKLPDHENIRVYYQTSTRAPAVTQLQGVVNNSNPLLLTAGNSNLKQSFTQTLLSRYSITTPEEGRSFFFLLSATFTNDYIGNETFAPSRDTIIDGTKVSPGTQLATPQNFDGYWSVRSFTTYGFPVDLIKTNVNLSGGVNYTQTPGAINNALNIAHAFTSTAGCVLGSNISPNLDFTLSYLGNYSISRNTLQSGLNSNYYSHTASLRFNWIFWDGVVFHDEITNALNNGQSNGYNQNSILWNMSLAKKLFAKQAGEIKLTVTDLLGQNKSISRTIASSYIEDDRNEVLTRYVLLTFTYTIR